MSKFTEIGIVMGGFINKEQKLLTRNEIMETIREGKREIATLKKELELARKLLISYNKLVKKDYKLDKPYSPKTDIDEWLTQNNQTKEKEK